jgi:hypothetical protein
VNPYDVVLALRTTSTSAELICVRTLRPIKPISKMILSFGVTASTCAISSAKGPETIRTLSPASRVSGARIVPSPPHSAASVSMPADEFVFLAASAS